MKLFVRVAAVLQACVLLGQIRAAEYFAITVVDAETGRGVPLVELRTVNSIAWWTDSNGVAAIDEPGLMDLEVYFHVQSHGYEYPKDMFDNRGVKLQVKRGARAEIKIKRLNIAERLYRITGEGIYRDSVLTGNSIPLKRSEINGQVLGQDTVIATPYRGKIYWFWGDTDKPSYPLGNFGSSGATSEPPGHGGLDPGVGIDLTYFVDKTGFSKPMCPNFGPGLQWIESLMTLDPGTSHERLVARVTSVANLAKVNGWHLALFNDEKQAFESLARWDVYDSHDVTNPFRVRVGTNEYFYLYPNYRVRAELPSLTNLGAYEAFTCLAPATRYEKGSSKIDRDANGSARYRWQAGAERLNGSRQRELIRSGSLKPAEAWRQLCDVETGEPNRADRGTVAWNAFRQRWVMIAGGLAGEVWFSEADTPLGPWVYSRRVVSHNHYNFYNVSHHPFFDQDNGRLVYFEGTYTAAFSEAKQKTPRYDYNQIMYRLRLDDERLALPAPVYAVRDSGGAHMWAMREQVAGAWSRIESLPFFAIPPGRVRKELIPIYAVADGGLTTLQPTPPPGSGTNATPLFFALPAVARPGSADPAGEFNSGAIAPLYAYRQAGGIRIYSTDPSLAEGERSPEPLCRVWKNPMSVLVLDTEAEPILAKSR